MFRLSAGTSPGPLVLRRDLLASLHVRRKRHHHRTHALLLRRDDLLHTRVKERLSRHVSDGYRLNSFVKRSLA